MPVDKRSLSSLVGKFLRFTWSPWRERAFRGAARAVRDRCGSAGRRCAVYPGCTEGCTGGVHLALPCPGLPWPACQRYRSLFTAGFRLFTLLRLYAFLFSCTALVVVVLTPTRPSLEAPVVARAIRGACSSLVGASNGAGRL